jgi:hypothetical protein
MGAALSLFPLAAAEYLDSRVVTAIRRPAL